MPSPLPGAGWAGNAALEFLNDAFMLRQARGHDEILAFADGGWYLIGQHMTAMANLGAYAHAELSARLPNEEFGVTWHPTWTGEKKQQIVTFRHFIPVGARQTDAAWQLATFLATSVEAQQFIYDTTGFFGPSSEFIGNFRADDPMTQWYVRSMSEAESLRFEVPFRFGPGIPSPDAHLNTAKFAVFEQAPAPSELEQANIAWEADIKRQTEQR